MILGIGVDLCSIVRMARSCQNRRLMEKIFTEEERRYAGTGPSAPSRLAGAFAAKEAFAKATGLGLAKTGLKNVFVTHREDGSPCLLISDENEWLKRFQDCRIHLSISHDGQYAVAMVLIEEALP